MKLGDKLTVKANPELSYAGMTGTICKVSPVADNANWAVLLRFSDGEICGYNWSELKDRSNPHDYSR